MIPQETNEKPKRGRKPKAEKPVATEDFVSFPTIEEMRQRLSRVELLASRRTDKEAKALLTGLAMGLKYAIGVNGLEERCGRFYLTSTDEL